MRRWYFSGISCKDTPTNTHCREAASAPFLPQVSIPPLERLFSYHWELLTSKEEIAICFQERLLVQKVWEIIKQGKPAVLQDLLPGTEAGEKYDDH